MSILETLIARAGKWQGTNQLQDPHTNASADSPSTLTVTPVLKGKFIRVDYTWAYQGTPEEGMLLIGYEEKTNSVATHWADTWHSPTVMVCQGTAEANDSMAVKGSYAAPPGPDWGWRITISSHDNQSLQMVMHNITPESQEYLAVEANYTRGNYD
jgi:Protein of unknown function (DUF1579)